MSVDYFKVLNLVEQGHWDEAHEIIQLHSDQYSCLIHGYLHRVEGDLSNARYWYRRAQLEMPDNSLEIEIKRIKSLLGYRSE